MYRYSTNSTDKIFCTSRLATEGYQPSSLPEMKLPPTYHDNSEPHQEMIRMIPSCSPHSALEPGTRGQKCNVPDQLLWVTLVTAAHESSCIYDRTLRIVFTPYVHHRRTLTTTLFLLASPPLASAMTSVY